MRSGGSSPAPSSISAFIDATKLMCQSWGMIPDNDRQASLLNARIERVIASLKSLDGWDALRTGIELSVIELRKKSLRETLNRLRSDVSAYAGIRSGEIKTFNATQVEGLPDILKRARLARGLTQRQFAELLGLKEQQIQRYEAENYATVSLRRLYDLFHVLNVSIKIEANLEAGLVELVSRGPIELNKLPYKEMLRRQWIRPDISEPEDVEVAAQRYVVQSIGENWSNFLHRQVVRANSLPDSQALLAWHARVCEIARTKKKNLKGDFFSLDLDWVRRLVELSKFDDGPRQAVDYLLSIGVIVVIEPHLEKTHLDGAATILDGDTPVIGLTLRFDRLDNFWFVLMHELGHLVLHAQFDDAVAFFDSDEIGVEKGKESEADNFARSTLIADEKWKTSLVRFAKSPDAVKSFATANGLSPAIVAGRIRRERNDFTIFSELVGQGSVRRQFGF
ncbi:helix-turn-helix domain-containing protein [Mesorhizobium sp. M7A.F.Ca.CA.001.09.2.1]|nr:helix-turn-helix domain-containing protein [Mesorhizobium sp. M7A.F.Ca.CA.001.13.2.1]RUY63955.1 helix-turn-helix domain-containing protein [Mesorhizobium sp. M7A.F.Ca.CA.001.05.1.1]RUY72143.1 helix-turn-helix domain-containing protein [Mesorhizobium sp. M7A.F.Ca.CA.001.13.1.1]RUY78646.1 helix-turn-helix domain-containing protein [Mesorhizobium sp. M7A.F.Ca.CA.001.09.2.1]RUZ01448.1 helix-turn-helix domain-containing protein [Mesorhizobium sp. M7A.F.Ca.CA.001.04.2.1]RUZ24619.1 helix-turn-heli